MFTLGGNRLAHRLGAGGQMAMHHEVAVVVQDATVQAPGVQVDTARKLVRRGGEAHGVSSA
jgi:hypothetical protein